MTTLLQFVEQNKKLIKDPSISETKKKQLQAFDSWQRVNNYDDNADYLPYWDKFIATYGDYDEKGNQIVYKEKIVEQQAQAWKMPIWGWITIGVGSAAILTLVIVLGIKASKKNQ